MNNAVPYRRSLSFLLLLATLALCVCLQITVAALQPQSLLTTLTSLFRAPGEASYPFNASYQVTLFSSPSTLYASTTPDSFALRASDGAVVQKIPERVFAVYQGIVYTSTFTSAPQESTTLVKAIRESDGNVLWSYSFKNLNDIQLIDGILYSNKYNMLLQQEVLQAFDPGSGHLLWQYQCPIQGCFVDIPQVQQGIAYAVVQGGSYSTLLALRASDGRLLWQVPQYIYALPPLLDTDRLLVRTSIDALSAYRATDGRLLWQIHVAINSIADTVSMISNGATGIIRTSTILYAFRMDSGTLLWQRQDSPLDIKMDDTTLYLSEPASLIALNATSGQTLWQQAFPAWAIKNAQAVRNRQGNPVLGESNGMLYMWLKGQQQGFALNDGVFAYSTADGHLVWQHSFTLPSTPEIPTPPGAQSFTAGSDMEFLLVGNSVYFTSYVVVTTVIPIHFTIFLNQALASFFNTTTFTLTSQAIDARSGSVKWQNKQVEQFRVA